MTLSATLPTISTEITIDGGNYTISGNESYQIFRVSYGSLTVNNATLNNGSAYEGGGIYSQRSSSISNNSACTDGDAISSSSSPIDWEQTTVINISITGSTFTDNSSVGEGGAIYHKDKVLSISSSTFTDNEVGSSGGALTNFASQSMINIANSTFSNNSATVGGGAIFNRSGTITVTHSTLNGNSSDSGSGGIGAVGGTHTVLNLRNSIVAGSTGSDCVGPLDHNVGNLIEDNTCSPSVSGDPLLDSITGSPAYYPLLSNSPAVNAGDTDYGLATDQAGNARPYSTDGSCDIGAYELQAAAAATDTPSAIATPTATATNTPTSMNTATPTLSDACVNVGPGTYRLLPPSRFLSGLISVYPGDTCPDFKVTQTDIGENGYVYTSSDQATAVSLCVSGYNDGSAWTAAQQAFNTDLWQCALPATDT